MVTLVTNGIKISVKVIYREEFSQPEKNYFLFSYFITIENKSDFTVQLLRRHWFIYDSIGETREVEGEGVVGVQPVLAPGEKYEYESACDLVSDMGKMTGTYLMQRELDSKEFYVNIPEFDLVHPPRLN
ncbi:MAG: Co2+/Mg2+ efflux protein ApaG [Bacteroidetes bacterium]|nr:Co2+/Mg2+ efflux protein ApaG [Bacteroidota bacterium]